MICVYDNPVTMRRECWQDGTLVCSLSAEMIVDREHIPYTAVFMGLDLSWEWKGERYFGDKKAMGEE